MGMDIRKGKGAKNEGDNQLIQINGILKGFSVRGFEREGNTQNCACFGECFLHSFTE
jgi:hypothetical protein